MGDPAVQEMFNEANTVRLKDSVWVLTILKELGSVLDKALAVRRSTAIHMRTTTLELQVFRTNTSSGLRLMSIPWHRAVWFYTVCAVQTSIAVMLLAAGTLWLMQTEEIQDLLLNCVALSYIVDTDELIYSVFMPSKITTLITVLDPLQNTWPIRLPARPLIMALGGLSFMAYASQLANHQGELLEEIGETLCGGLSL